MLLHILLPTLFYYILFHTGDFLFFIVSAIFLLKTANMMLRMID